MGLVTLLADAVTPRATRSLWGRIFLDAPRWWFHGFCAVVSLALLALFSDPVPEFFPIWFCVGLLVIAGAVWLIRLIAHLFTRGRPGRWWLVAPIGGFVVAMLLSTQAPLQARFALSQGELGSFARSVLATPDPAAAAQQAHLGIVGTYRVHAIDVTGGVVFFTTSESGGFLTGKNGFAYLPERSARPTSERIDGRTLTHLRGPWFSWARNF